MRSKQKRLLIARYSTMIIVSLMFLIPLAWMLVTSIKGPNRVFTRPIEWFPDRIHLENYSRLFTEYEFHKYIWSTVKLCALNILGTVLSCSVIAYGFAFGEYKHKDKIFFVVLLTMMIPGAAVFFPHFLLFARIGWYGTLLPLWVPSFLGSAYYIFFLRQYYLTIPLEMLEAARLEGCNELEVLWHVVVPMARPVYIVMILNTFIGVWGDFFNQLIYITSAKDQTISLALKNLNASYGGSASSLIPSLMAGSVIVSIPVLLVYYYGQKHMINSYVFKDIGK